MIAKLSVLAYAQLLTSHSRASSTLLSLSSRASIDFALVKPMSCMSPANLISPWQCEGHCNLEQVSVQIMVGFKIPGVEQCRIPMLYLQPLPFWEV